MADNPPGDQAVGAMNSPNAAIFLRGHTTLRNLVTLNRRGWVALLGALLLAALATGYLSARNRTDAEVVVPVTIRTIQQSVRAAGVVKPLRQVDIGARVTGQVRAIHVQLGQRVTRGQLLLTLDPALADSELRRADARVEADKAEIDVQRALLDQAQWTMDQQRTLLAGDATSGVEARRAATDVVRLTALLRELHAALESDTADLARMRLRRRFTEVTAPTAGDVVRIAVQEGETVNAEQSAPTLVSIAILDMVTIHSQVPEADVGRIRLGQETRFITLGNASHEYRAKVKTIEPVPDQVSGAVFYNVLFDVANNDRVLLIDMTVDVRYVEAESPRVLTIPSAALGPREPDGTFAVAVRLDDGRVVARRISVGLTDSRAVEVVRGLTATDKVVLSPPAVLFSGAALSQ